MKKVKENKIWVIWLSNGEEKENDNIKMIKKKDYFTTLFDMKKKLKFTLKATLTSLIFLKYCKKYLLFASLIIRKEWISEVTLCRCYI